MDEIAEPKSDKPGRGRSLANLKPPRRPGDPPLPGAGRPRRGQSKLAKVFSVESRRALAEMGITLPPGTRIDVDAVRDACRELAPEMIAHLRWLAAQKHRAGFATVAATAASDILKYAGVEGAAKIQIEHSGTVQHQHTAAATAAFLDSVLGRVPATVEGEVIHSPEALPAVEHNHPYVPIPDLSTGEALPAVDVADLEPAPPMPAGADLAGQGRE